METMEVFFADIDSQLTSTKAPKATGTMAGPVESNEMRIAIFV